MKVKVLLFFIAFGFFSCAEKKSNELPESAPETVNESEYPENLQKIFDAHGGLSLWESFGSLGFTIQKNEQTSSFKTNFEKSKFRVESINFKLGFDGRGSWSQDETTSFNESLYAEYSRILYGAAMPFMIVQDGAFYTQRLDQTISRVTYGVIHIGFGRGSGKSSDVEYVIYYDKETYQIVWLAQRVVEYGRYKRKYWEFIKYTSFQNISGLLLPEKWTLYEAEGNRPTKALYPLEIKEMVLSEDTFEDSVFEAPDGSEFK